MNYSLKDLRGFPSYYLGFSSQVRSQCQEGWRTNLLREKGGTSRNLNGTKMIGWAKTHSLTTNEYMKLGKTPPIWKTPQRGGEREKTEEEGKRFGDKKKSFFL